MQPRGIVATYFLIQSAGTAAWWVLLLLNPSSIDWFQPAQWPAASLLSFWLADFVLIVGGSLFVAIGVLNRKRWSTVAVWSLAAAVWYPTLVCIAASIQTGQAWIAAAMMTAMAGMSLAMATVHGNLSQSPATIRVSPMDKKEAVAWTLAQIMIFWGAFLFVFPLGIVELQRQFGMPMFQHAGQGAISLTLLITASLLGLWSGATMATRGAGTPLPTATAPRLVVTGPYRFVRNPMALAGIGQGIAVAWYLGSYPVIAYALAGAIVWHVFVRPVEERDLAERFGESYRRYRRSVGLWLPRRRKAESQTLAEERGKS